MSGPLSVNASGSRGGELLLAFLLLPLLAAVAPRWLAAPRGRRVAAAALFSTAVLAAYFAVKLLSSGATEPSELLQPLWQVLAIHQLQLGVGLCLDASAAVLLCSAALLGAWAVGTEAPGRAGWLGGACLFTAVGLLGDSLVLRLAGWELLTVAGFLLSQQRNRAVLVLGRVGDAALFGALVLLFWGLCGSWSSSRLDAHYQLDFRPPLEEAAAAAPAAAAPGPSLQLQQLRLALHAPSAAAPAVPAARQALANKLWLGGRLLGWLMAWFALAAGLKSAAALTQLWTERRAKMPVRLFLFAAPIFVSAQLLWRLW